MNDNRKITKCNKELVKLDCLIKDAKELDQANEHFHNNPVKKFSLELSKIASIYICSFQFTSLDSDIFQHLNKLSQIILIDNKLTELDAGIFKGLTNLMVLLLNENRLESLDPNIFNGLIKLEKLDLTGCDEKYF